MRWYVYELVDPMTGNPFYIGKGCGRRMRCHLGVKAAPMVKMLIDSVLSLTPETSN